MSPFVQGIIEEMEGDYGSYYELMLRLAAEQTIPVFYKLLEEDLGEQAKEIAAGGYLTWEPSRVDLLAILHKDEHTDQ